MSGLTLPMVISAVMEASFTVRVDAAAVKARTSPVLVVVEEAVFCLVVADDVAVSVALVAVVAARSMQARSRINGVPFAVVNMVASGCERSCVVRVRFEVRERYCTYVCSVGTLWK